VTAPRLCARRREISRAPGFFNQERDMSQRLHPLCPSLKRNAGLRRSMADAMGPAHSRRWALALIIGIVLAACGGGGHDDSPPISYEIKRAWVQLFAATSSWTMTGSGPNAQSFTLTVAFEGMPEAPFPVNGVTARRMQETITVDSGGQSQSDSQVIYLDPATFGFVGLESAGFCSVATSNTALPDTASRGSSGPLFVVSDLDGCASTAAVVGTTTGTWSLEVDGVVTLLCWNLSAKDATGAPSGSMSTCAEIGTNGSLGTKARFIVKVPGLTDIVARNF
jgi:hypothetical protein